jgi:hypothetical protein
VMIGDGRWADGDGMTSRARCVPLAHGGIQKPHAAGVRPWRPTPAPTHRAVS